MKYLLTFLSLLFLISTPSAYQSDKDDWTGDTKYANGWSDWSIRDDFPAVSVRKKVYLPVESWGGQQNNNSKYNNPIYSCTVNNPTDSCLVRKKDGTKTTYKGSNSWESTKCGPEGGTYGSSSAGCSCSLDKSQPTGWCVKGGEGMCGEMDPMWCDTKQDKEEGYTQKCFWFKCGQDEKEYHKSCNNNEVSGDNGCGTHSTYYYVKEATSFKDHNNKSNWKTSVSNAGGYAKVIYVYSYPLDFYINFNGNGANGTCDFKSGSNSFSNANNIAYNLWNIWIKY